MSVRVMPASVRSDAFPPLLLAGALLLWGWQTQHLLLAVAMALVHELAPLLPWRWRFGAGEFSRLVDLTAVLFVVAALYQFDARGVHGVYGILAWVPLLLFVLLGAQRFSEAGRIGLSALFLSVRRALARGELDEERSVDFAYPYFALTLLSATGGVVRGPYLLPALGALLLWGLWYARPAHARPGRWLALVMLAAALGVAAQAGLIEARRALEPLVMDLLREYVVTHRNPFRARTAIGDVGRLKGLERIEMRVWPDADGGADGGASRAVPALLQEATYRVFSRNSWLAGQQSSEVLSAQPGGLRWLLAGEPARADARLRMSRHLPGGRGLLALPPAAVALDDLAVEGIERHQFGALEVRNGPQLLIHDVEYRAGQVLAAAPDQVDLAVPPDQDAVLGTVLAQLQLGEAPPAEVLARLRAWFATEFRYALPDGGWRRRPLEAFLLDTRSGHCEYFATATVLLLRAAGVPARYATGWAVREWSGLDEAFVVRRRHAHAWALAHVGGRWIEVDTTPASWVLEEDAAAPWWRDIYDTLAWLHHGLERWRWRAASEEQSPPWMLLLAVPLVGVLLWRLRAQRVRTGAGPRARAATADGAGSALAAVERRLAAEGLGARGAETLWAWFTRLDHADVFGPQAAALREAVHLHQRLRYDPRGLDGAGQQRLMVLCQDWLQAHAEARAAGR